MTKLLVTGGLQRTNAIKLGEGRRYRRGRLLSADFETRQVMPIYELSEANEHYPDETPNLLFTAATLYNGRLYLCSETELFIFSYPELVLEQSASHHFFQNIHHVTPIGEHVLVASTGLDLVVALDAGSLEPVRFWNALGKDPWYRFSPRTDYRKVHTTKPHESHPNFVFSINGEIWITRFKQRDAVCLSDFTRRIDLGAEGVHDGHVVGNLVYFTAVNGQIIVADTETLSVTDVIDLNEIDQSGCPLGWCRGLAIVDHIAFVGFSRIRATPLKENLLWMARWNGRPRILPTRIAAYDIHERRKLDEFVLGDGRLDTIYSVIAVGD